ncbi:MAG TPA: ATP-binding protein [Mucilaginibacter sp.]|jgi:two-component system sensor histidine kinase VicK|nr:ATP-binding protein [Mucilaginibacter sp.]
MPEADSIKTTYHQCLEGGGEMGERIRSFDWAKTVLGTPDTWPQSLLTAVGIILNSRFPMFIWWGPDLVQFYNDAYRPSLGREGKHPSALGQRGEECWTEIWPVIKPLIDQVITGGPSTWSEDQLIPIYRNGKLENVYWTFSYSRIHDDSGGHGGILVVCNETTSKIKALDELTKAKQDLEKAQTEALRQRDRLKSFLVQAPAGICVLDGPNMVFELVNDPYQQLFPGRQLVGKPLLEAVPEVKGQPIWDILQDVYQTGKTFEGNGLLIPLARHDGGEVEDRYFNFIYQARYNAAGNVDGILVFVFEVTEMVNARHDLEREKDKLKLAIKAAELGTFDMDLIKGTMEWDKRCRNLFGISHSDIVTYEKDFITGLHPDDRNRVVEIINNVFVKAISNGDYDVEYRTVGVEDDKVRWVRAKGKTYFDENDRPTRFVGAVLDITEQKFDELRKNDFIGMVSHELKTPLTSLSAYVQMLHAKALKEQDNFVSGALDKVNIQVRRMGTMINGFLNVSRLESGKILLDKHDFMLNELVLAMTEEIRQTGPGHNLECIIEKPITVHADQDKIGSVIINLLSNAVKYSAKGKTITINCRVTGNMAQVSVHDEGIGIKRQDMDKLFERYFRAESPQTKYISGFGIGLYLSAEIIQRHNGKIWAESEVNKGSTFYFTLPLDK